MPPPPIYLFLTAENIMELNNISKIEGVVITCDSAE